MTKNELKEEIFKEIMVDLDLISKKKGSHKAQGGLKNEESTRS